MSVAYKYEVSVGGGGFTSGEVFLSENATGDEILLAIMDDLYSVSYEKAYPDEQDPDPTKPIYYWYRYTVHVGNGCALGSVLLKETATDDEIRLAIMDDLYSVYYKKQES